VTLVVALWWLTAAASPDAGQPPFEWDVPGAVEATVVAREALINGLPMSLSAVRSTRPIDELLVHYAKRFLERGFFIPPHIRPIPGFDAARVMAWDPVGRRSYLVYGWREDAHSSTLILGSANLGARKAAASTGEGLPTFPGAKHVLRFDLESSRGASFEVTASADELLDFYRTTLGAAGWQAQGDTFVRQGKAVEVLSRTDPRRPGILSVVVLEQPQPEGLPTEPTPPKR
jgi:hypothetical protein